MKKLLIVMVGLLIALPMFAQVTVDAPDVPERVDVTFEYENPDASEVFLIGGFNGWAEADPEYAMEEVDGVWTYTMNARSNATLIYKFFVDGEYVEDPNAPATRDDGFGGENGVANIGNMLGAGGGDAVSGVEFGNFTTIASRTMQSGDDDPTSDIKYKSYWKIFNVPVWENLEISMIEIAIDDTVVNLYDGDDVEVDGLFEWLSAPLTGNEYKAPFLGHFALGMETEYADLGWYYNYAKGSEYNKYYFKNYSEQDGVSGRFEVSKDGLEVGDGIAIDYLFGLGTFGRAGLADGNITYLWDRNPELTGPTGEWLWQTRGFWRTLSYLDVNVADQTFGLMVNTMSNVAAGEPFFGDDDNDGYFDTLSTELALGATGSAGPLSYGTQMVMHFYDGIDFELEDHILYGLNLEAGLVEGLTTEFDLYVTGAGILPNVFAQNNDEEFDDGDGYPHVWDGNTGRMKLELNNEYSVDAFSAALDLSAETYSPLLDVDTDNDWDLQVRPKGSFNVDEDITVGVHTGVNIAVRENAPDGGQALNFLGAGVYGDLSDMGIPRLRVGLDVGMNNNHVEDSDAHDPIFFTLLAQADLGDGMGASAGVRWQDLDDDPFGLGLGFSKAFDGNGFAGGTFFTNLNVGLNIFGNWDEGPGLERHGDDYYIDRGRTTYDGWAAAVGMRWDF